MSELTVLGNNLPAHLRTGELDDTTKALMGGSGVGMKRISIKGGVWRMMVGNKEVATNEDRAMNVVIVAAAPKVSRHFYEGTYKEGVNTGPDCWSADGEVPDSTAANPQAKSCANCPQNVKGSGEGTTRACRFQQRVAVVLENNLGGDVYQLTLPSQSIFGEGEPGKWPLQTYGKMLGGRGVPVTAVVTEMRFDTKSATPRLTFKPVRYLEEDEFQTCINQGKSAAATKAIVTSYAPSESPVEAPKSLVNSTPPAKKAVVEDEEEEVKEPVKRTTSKKEEDPAPKKDVNKILAEWDDE